MYGQDRDELQKDSNYREIFTKKISIQNFELIIGNFVANTNNNEKSKQENYANYNNEQL